MNKKYVICSLLVMFFATGTSFTLYNFIFQAAQLIGKGTLPVMASLRSYSQLKKREEIGRALDAANGDMALVANILNGRYSDIIVEPAPMEVDRLLRKEMERLGDPLLQKLPIVSSPFLEASAAVLNDKVLIVGSERAEILNDALLNKGDNSDQIIRENIMIGLHEIGHLTQNDSQKQLYASALITMATEGFSSGASRIVNKMCGNARMPKTLLKTAFRSSMAIGSIIPKVCLNAVGLASYCRFVEARADRFACEHAENREQLEAFHGSFKEQQDDFEKRYQFPADASEFMKKNTLRFNFAKESPTHPYFGDRADMVKKYIDRWGAEHPGDKQ
jgi:Peptidase family M48